MAHAPIDVTDPAVLRRLASDRSFRERLFASTEEELGCLGVAVSPRSRLALQAARAAKLRGQDEFREAQVLRCSVSF